MPIKNGIGYSETTPLKQHHFRENIRVHLRIVRGIMQKYPAWGDGVYHYFDLNAGSGLVDGVSGSPLIFIEESMHYPTLNVHAVLIEINKSNAESLARNLALYHATNCKIDVRCGDHADVLPEFFTSKRTKSFGLVYTDPTGSIPPFDLLAEMASVPCYEKTDFLISCSATTIKRVRGCSKCPSDKYLTDYLNTIDKKYWNVREPLGRHQWTLLIGSNWNAYPSFKNLGFYSADSLEGRKVLSKLNFTEKELTNGENSC